MTRGSEPKLFAVDFRVQRVLPLKAVIRSGPQVSSASGWHRDVRGTLRGLPAIADATTISQMPHRTVRPAPSDIVVPGRTMRRWNGPPSFFFISVLRENRDCDCSR